MNIANPEWVRFKNSFSQRQEDAIWQYLLDHSKVQSNGYFGIMFYVLNIDDFFRRLYARYSGDFKRYDRLEKENKQALAELYYHRNFNIKRGKQIDAIDKGNSIHKKLLLFIDRKIRLYLFGK